jgi:hypothetical protein
MLKGFSPARQRASPGFAQSEQGFIEANLCFCHSSGSICFQTTIAFRCRKKSKFLNIASDFSLRASVVWYLRSFVEEFCHPSDESSKFLDSGSRNPGL